VHLTALVESPQHVCCRYRLAAYQSFFQSAGHSLVLQSLPQQSWRRLRLLNRVQDIDGVIVQRKLLGSCPLSLLRRAARLLIFDFDDAVFLRDSYSVRGFHSLRRIHAFAAMVETADLVVAGNSYLADQAARWTSPNRIHVVPTCLDPARYPLARHEAASAAELVWIGSSSTLRGIERIAPLLDRIGRHRPELRLKLVCDRFIQLRHLPIVCCSWSEQSEAEDLAAADIGISWVPDDPWSRGKCGLKILQYMAAGLPVVANPVGVQKELVTDGETGFLVNTPAEWEEAIGRLAGDPHLRRRLGQAGRRRLEQDFSVSAGAARWIELLGQAQSWRQAA
jgi:glycosyltransferase involved in cell wall biosynthesis